MKTRTSSIARVCIPALMVIIPLIAATWFIPPRFPLFGAQHLYLIFTIGWVSGVASVILAALLAFPLSFVFERGGRWIGGPAILHTSSNAPVLIFALPDSFIARALVPHMGVVLSSLYLAFLFRKVFGDPR